MAFALAPALIQYGLPAGIKGIEFLISVLEKARNNPDMTQEEFNAEWLKMQKEYVTDGVTWDTAGQSPSAQA